ncbi:NADP-dependent malic enzyme 2, partial [Nymphaea thermarum]
SFFFLLFIITSFSHTRFLVFASGYSLLRDPKYNKGLTFSEKERDAHYLRGLLPPVCLTQELQAKKLMQNLCQYQVPLQRYMALMELQERNERLFYKLLIDNVEELLPIVYTPTVGEACQKYGSIFRRPQGLYISLNEKGKILEVLKNWPEKGIQVIVVTDGERILAGTGIAKLIALEMSRQGLIVNSRKQSLQHFKKPWAHEQEPVKTLLEAVKAIKPTVLIGSSGKLVAVGLFGSLQR